MLLTLASFLVPFLDSNPASLRLAFSSGWAFGPLLLLGVNLYSQRRSLLSNKRARLSTGALVSARPGLTLLATGALNWGS